MNKIIFIVTYSKSRSIETSETVKIPQTSTLKDISDTNIPRKFQNRRSHTITIHEPYHHNPTSNYHKTSAIYKNAYCKTSIFFFSNDSRTNLATNILTLKPSSHFVTGTGIKLHLSFHYLLLFFILLATKQNIR